VHTQVGNKKHNLKSADISQTQKLRTTVFSFFLLRTHNAADFWLHWLFLLLKEGALNKILQIRVSGAVQACRVKKLSAPHLPVSAIKTHFTLLAGLSVNHFYHFFVTQNNFCPHFCQFIIYLSLFVAFLKTLLC